MQFYYRPILQTDIAVKKESFALAGGKIFFGEVEVIQRNSTSYIVPASKVPSEIKNELIRPREAILGLSGIDPIIMGILNVTPDSFSDGRKNHLTNRAVKYAKRMVKDGVKIIDIGGESTRPGFKEVSIEEELSRVIPVIEEIRSLKIPVVISVDTRKAPVAERALRAGANMINDVSAMGFDKNMAKVIKSSGAPICLMHSHLGAQENIKPYDYTNVLLDVYDFLAQKIRDAEAHGIPKSQIILDPGIGFNKNLNHNLLLLNRVSLFHSLGCQLLVGASRKGFIGAISGENDPEKRLVGSIVVSLGIIEQGVQILRVHDIAEHQQALLMWKGITYGCRN